MASTRHDDTRPRRSPGTARARRRIAAQRAARQAIDGSANAITAAIDNVLHRQPGH